jgi:pimeloyl-ACP methyl ester carboxylesterase
MNDSILLPDDLLARIRVPVCFVWGEDDPFGDAAVARAFSGKVPGARLVLLPDAGHAVWVDEPARVGELVREFLSAPEGS